MTPIRPSNTTGLTLGQSLAGLKVIMAEAGLCQPYMLPPLSMLDEETTNRIKEQAADVLKKYI